MASILQNGGVTTRIICNEVEWDAIRSDWDALFTASPYASTPLDFEWLRGWWRIYGPVYGVGGLRIMTVWRESRLIGAIPLYLGGQSGWCHLRVLRFISTGEAEDEETCPDYLNFLCLPGEEGACISVMSDAVNQLKWDELELLDVPSDSPLLRWQQFPGRGIRSGVIQRGYCPIADLGQGFEAYLTQLSAKPRQHARQYIRAADKSGAVFELALESEVDEYFDDLIRLHQERWIADGKPGCFAAPRFTQFHRHLARQWVPSGRAILARLSHEGQVYAVIYGFITCGKYDFYQSGVRRSDVGPFESPGTTINLLLMKALSGRGVKAYDFLRGSSSYKQRLASRKKKLIGIRIWRPTVRCAIYHAGGLAKKIGRSVLRLMGKGM